MTGERGFRLAASKIVDLAEAEARARAWRESGSTIVYTNGCFDLLHAGHVRMLEAARGQGDALIVGMNSDESARRVKGPGRPVIRERERAEALAALECVDLVVVFGEETSLPVLQSLRPEVWVKGGDYQIDTVNQAERAFVEEYGGRVALTEHVQGVSTSDIIARIRKLSPNSD